MKSRATRGFTLVELMVAMVIGLVLMAGVVTLFMSSRRSFDVDGNVAGMQDEARFALKELARDLSMAGYVGEPLVPGAIVQDGTLDLVSDCGPPAAPVNWMYRLTDAGNFNTLVALDNATGADAAASFSCIDAGEVLAGNDVVAVKRVAGDPMDAAALDEGGAYLRSNGTTGVLFVGLDPDTAVPGVSNNWRYLPRIYYVRNFADAPGDGTPTLCRKTLLDDTPPDITTECIARGVERLQIQYGLDSDGDGNANRYVPEPVAAEIATVVTARLSLLVRTANADRRYTDERDYQIGNENPDDFPGNDNFHRRVYSMTLTVHNLRNLRRLGI